MKTTSKTDKIMKSKPFGLLTLIAIILIIFSIASYNIIIGVSSKVYSNLMKELDWAEKEEICYISSIINSECTNCSKEEKALIGSVVLNRCRTREMFLAEVLYEENQFNGVRSPQFHPTVENDSIAARLLRGEGRNQKFQYFYTGEPCWSISLVNVKRQSWHHTFSY
jgi:hypothetical protein